MQQSAVKVRVFFDIDGTLLLTDGAGRSALQYALESVFGTVGNLPGYTFHGKTDPQIVLELMGAAGLAEQEIRRGMPEMWPVYLSALERELEARRSGNRITLLPGVTELLAALEAHEDTSIGLLTGNLERGAQLKLEAAGLWSRFGLGAFASDSEDRAEIAQIAVERSWAASGLGSSGLAHLVIGDTPADVDCARAAGAYALAVATGRHGIQELERSGADVVFGDLSETEQVLDWILSLRDGGGGDANRDDGGGR